MSVHNYTSNMVKFTSHLCWAVDWSCFLPHLLSFGDILRLSALPYCTALLYSWLKKSKTFQHFFSLAVISLPILLLAKYGGKYFNLITFQLVSCSLSPFITGVHYDTASSQKNIHYSDRQLKIHFLWHSLSYCGSWRNTPWVGRRWLAKTLLI